MLVSNALEATISILHVEVSSGALSRARPVAFTRPL